MYERRTVSLQAEKLGCGDPYSLINEMNKLDVFFLYWHGNRLELNIFPSKSLENPDWDFHEES